MNQLPLATRAAIVSALVEGTSLRATARITGTSKTTVTKLLVDLGELCAIYQHHVLRRLTPKRVQCDEIWSFVGCKQKRMTEGGQGDGDVYTFTAMDADSKLMITWLVGRRTPEATRQFIRDLASRLASRVQITTDGYNAYLSAVEGAFGWMGCDFAQVVKVYANPMQGSNNAARRYSPGKFVAEEKTHVMGNPDMAHVSTSFVERQNLTMRMQMRRFTRLTNAFSKKVENHAHAVALHFMHYNFCRPHQTLTKAAKGVHTTPAMAAGLTGRVWKVQEICKLLDPNELLHSA